MNRGAQSKTISVLTAIMLLITYIACGFIVCAGIPTSTEKLSLLTSDFDESPYGKPALTEIALEVRDFTISDYGREEFDASGAENALADFVIGKAKEASGEGSPTVGLWSADALAVLEGDAPSSDQMMYELAEVGEQYALTADAISHLNDVNDLVSRLFVPLLSIVVLALFCLLVGFRNYGYRCTARGLLYAGIATIALFAILGAWALISFDSLFAVFHSLFFAEGTWTFSPHSLLIEMYPTGFWVGMGVVWLVSSCALALLSILFGMVLNRAANKRAAALEQMRAEAAAPEAGWTADAPEALKALEGEGKGSVAL